MNSHFWESSLRAIWCFLFWFKNYGIFGDVLCVFSGLGGFPFDTSTLLICIFVSFHFWYFFLFFWKISNAKNSVRQFTNKFHNFKICRPRSNSIISKIFYSQTSQIIYGLLLSFLEIHLKSCSVKSCNRHKFNFLIQEKREIFSKPENKKKLINKYLGNWIFSFLKQENVAIIYPSRISLKSLEY